ncbi:MAG: HAD-IA family hydrolase [Bacillota bacterium]
MKPDNIYGYRYANIIFDLDGTLTDSAAGVTRSVQYALSKFGIEEEPGTLRSFIGPPLLSSFQNKYGFSEKEAHQAIDYFREYYREKGAYENILYPYVPQMLGDLSSKGLKIYLATSKLTYFAELILRYFELEHYFTFVAGANQAGNRVEKADVLAYLLSENKIMEKAKTVMVGDRKHDIIGAHKCNLDSIAVTYGYGSFEELKVKAPTYFAASVPELKKLLLKK